MIVLDKLILKDGGGAAVAVARIGRDGSTFRIEISGGVGYDSLAYAAGGKTYIARGQAAECGANVYAAALLRNGAVVAAGGKTDDGEFVSALKAVGDEDRQNERAAATVVDADDEKRVEAEEANTVGATAEAVGESAFADGEADHPSAEEAKTEPTEESEEAAADTVASEEAPQTQAGIPEAQARKNESGDREFYELVKPKLDELFEGRKRVEALEKVFPDSEWVEVDDGREGVYVVGRVGAPPEFICYGIPDADGSTPPETSDECRQWLPMPGGGGYWMMYQSAKDGRTLTSL